MREGIERAPCFPRVGPGDVSTVHDGLRLATCKDLGRLVMIGGKRSFLFFCAFFVGRRFGLGGDFILFCFIKKSFFYINH